MMKRSNITCLFIALEKNNNNNTVPLHTVSKVFTGKQVDFRQIPSRQFSLLGYEIRHAVYSPYTREMKVVLCQKYFEAFGVPVAIFIP
jgi:hypothetical protein